MSEYHRTVTAEDTLGTPLYEITPTGGQIYLAHQIVDHFAFLDIGDPIVAAQAINGRIERKIPGAKNDFELKHATGRYTKIILSGGRLGTEVFRFTKFEAEPELGEEDIVRWSPSKLAKDRLAIETPIGNYTVSQAAQIMEAKPRKLDETKDLFELKATLLDGSRQLVNGRLNSALYEMYEILTRPQKPSGFWRKAVSKLTRQ